MKPREEINIRRAELRLLRTPEEASKDKAKSRAWYQKNKDRVSREAKEKYALNKTAFSLKNKASHSRHRGKRLALMRRYREPRRYELAQKSRLYYLENKESIAPKKRAYEARRIKENHQFRLSVRIRHRMRQAIKLQKGRKFCRFLEMTGCSSAFLIRWIAAQFQDGMTWKNYGLVWHVDHRKPLSSFDLTEERNQKAAAHFTNLQPLFALDNLKKGDKILASP
jgi:hypothetical protein